MLLKLNFILVSLKYFLTLFARYFYWDQHNPSLQKKFLANAIRDLNILMHKYKFLINLKYPVIYPYYSLLSLFVKLP